MKPAITFLVLLSLLLAATGEVGTGGAWSGFRLDNGLEVIVVEDHATPFVRIDLVFRAGAIAQGAANAGHFHVLEHVLLDGSEEGNSIASRLETLVPLTWNGEASAESLVFRMKVESPDLAAGMALWGDLVRKNSFGQDVVEAAKAVVSVEALAQLSDADSIFEAAMTKRLFSKYPWRRDPAGSPALIAAATPEGLARLKDLWILPGNATLVVVGDVDAAEVSDIASRSFAGWREGPSPWKSALPPQPKLGTTRPTWFFMADSAVPEGLALAEIRYRGPDLSTDLPATYAADLWSCLVGDPQGRFGKALLKAVPALHGESPVSVRYLSQKDGGILSVSAAIDLEKPGVLLARARAFKESFRGDEVTAMRNNPAYFSEAELEAARSRLLEARALALDTIDGKAAELDFAVASASSDWYRGYEGKIAATGLKDIDAFLDTWILHNLEVVALRLNPADYEREARALQAGGFEPLKPTATFWWQTR